MTWNNYPENYIDIVKKAFEEKTWFSHGVFKQKKGKEGTMHIQGVFSLKEKQRPTAFKFGKLKCGVFEDDEWTEEEDIKKCVNESVPWWRPVNDEKVIAYCGKLEISEGEITRMGKWPRELELITPDRPYQIFIINEIISKRADDRLVYWFYNKRGNVGKSEFCKWICEKYDHIFINDGEADIMCCVMADPELLKVDNLVVLIDLPREDGNKVSYKSLESIKNGLIFSPKYESRSARFNSPHIIVFAIEPPDIDTMSIDRWRIYEIFDDYTFEYVEIDVDLYKKLHPKKVIAVNPFFNRSLDPVKAAEMVRQQGICSRSRMVGDSIFSTTSEDMDDEESEDEADCYYVKCKDAEIKREAYVRKRGLEKHRRSTRPGFMGDSIISNTSEDHR